MNEDIIREMVKDRAITAGNILKVMTDNLNLPDNNLFYETLLELPIIKERIEIVIERKLNEI